MDDLTNTGHPAEATDDVGDTERPSSEAATAAAQAPDSKPPSVDQVKMALRKVKDPELNLNIVDLGLVYEISVDGSDVQIDMTLTSPGCPAGPPRDHGRRRAHGEGDARSQQPDAESRVAAVLVARPDRAQGAQLHGLVGPTK